MSLPNISPVASPDLRIQRSRQFIIQSEVNLKGEVFHTTIFFWSVYQLGDKDILLFTRNGSSEMLISPRLLPVGVYLVQLNVSMVGTAMFGVGQGYFMVVSSPLVAFIAGGSKVARGSDKTLSFDASLSHDPDEENQQFSG